MGIKVSNGPDLKRGAGLIKEAVETAGEDVAQEAFDEVHQRLRAVLKHPTGHYESRVQVSNQSNTLQISDGGVVYGPWLEGTSSRNGSTRFKGYHTFRQVLQRMDQKAEQVADHAIAAAVKKI
jgi:hypothetical protein